jgi:Xaa-Pro aminopeptidase
VILSISASVVWQLLWNTNLASTDIFLGEVSKQHEKIHEATLAAQDSVIDLIKPGAVAQDIYFAARETYLSYGYSPGYRVGRGIGISNLEKPELKAGDKTILQEGMTLTADGGITIANKLGIRVSDSLVVTNAGNVSLTPYPRALTIV